MSAPSALPAQVAAGPAELDPEQLAMLRGLRQGTLLPLLLRTYRDQMAQQLGAMNAAVAAGDVAALGGVAHSLKSASYSIGARRIGDLCAAIEAAARRGDASDAPRGCAQLAEAWERLQPEIEGHLAR
ncbi:MAG: Hpt domain-containing protein [Steroidobacteraceae bacterium]|jgi:HPt (histidine-containing phosphotransfer) domain-containing protein|nr:Hpt domain-containing protein [Steroidobacteraceae bacterium]